MLHVSQPVSEGVARWVALLAADQVARGWSVHVASPDGALRSDVLAGGDGQLSQDVLAAGAAHHVWDASRGPGAAVLSEARALAAIIKRVDPDLVHLHSSKAGLAGRLVLRGSRPTIFQPHCWSFEAVGGLVAKVSKAWERFGARWATRTICVSSQEQKAGVAAGVPQLGSVVIRNGVDLKRWPMATAADRRQARLELDLPANAPIAVTVGRLAPQKGQDVLLKAWPRVLSAVPGAQLYLVGDGPDRDALRAAAARLSGVHVVGSRNDVGLWLAASDVVVMPSRWEGLALTALEAAATGRSLVATDVAGMGEVIGEGDAKAGVIVPLGGELVPMLAHCLAERLKNLDLASQEGDNGRSRAVAEFDLKTALDRTAALTMILCAMRADEVRADQKLDAGVGDV